jgi:putative two-component system response regulator
MNNQGLSMFKATSESYSKETLDFITRMAYMAEVKEWDNRQHLERVRRYCYIIANGLDLSQKETETISIASLLHDIGKINIPDDLLRKKGEYEGFEWEVIEKHTIEGANILKGSSSVILKTSEVIALSHHERWNGSGYPHGLRGNEIPLSGRIFAVADVFDALTTPRIYKAAIEISRGKSMIEEASGNLFDPRVVKVFVQRFSEIQKIKDTFDS